MAETNIKYCLTFETQVVVSGYNQNGLCPCLNCDLQKCLKSKCESWDRAHMCNKCKNYTR